MNVDEFGEAVTALRDDVNALRRPQQIRFCMLNAERITPLFAAYWLSPLSLSYQTTLWEVEPALSNYLSYRRDKYKEKLLDLNEKLETIKVASVCEIKDQDRRSITFGVVESWSLLIEAAINDEYDVSACIFRPIMVMTDVSSQYDVLFDNVKSDYRIIKDNVFPFRPLWRCGKPTDWPSEAFSTALSYGAGLVEKGLPSQILKLFK